MQSITRECYDRAKKLLTEKSEEMHLLAKTLLEVETLEIEQIKSLIEKGTIVDADGEDSGSGEEPKTELIVDTVGDVKVRIQTREDEPLTTMPDLRKDEGTEEEPK